MLSETIVDGQYDDPEVMDGGGIVGDGGMGGGGAKPKRSRKQKDNGGASMKTDKGGTGSGTKPVFILVNKDTGASSVGAYEDEIRKLIGTYLMNPDNNTLYKAMPYTPEFKL